MKAQLFISLQAIHPEYPNVFLEMFSSTFYDENGNPTSVDFTKEMELAVRVQVELPIWFYPEFVNSHTLVAFDPLSKCFYDIDGYPVTGELKVGYGPSPYSEKTIHLDEEKFMAFWAETFQNDENWKAINVDGQLIMTCQKLAIETYQEPKLGTTLYVEPR